MARNDKEGFYEVFDTKTGKVVAKFDHSWEALEHAEKLGSEYDYDISADD